MLKILDCMYFCTVMLSTQYSIGAYQTFNVTRVELIRIRHIPETRRALRRDVRNCLHVCNVKIDVNYGVSYLNVNVKVLFGRVHNFFKLLTKCHCTACT